MALRLITMTSGVVVVAMRGMITKVVDTIRVEDVADTVEIAITIRAATDLRMPIAIRQIPTWGDIVQAPTTWAMVTVVDTETPVLPRGWIIMVCNSNNREEEEDMAVSPTKTAITKKAVPLSKVEVSSSSPICTSNPWGCKAHLQMPILEKPLADGHPDSKIGVGVGSRRTSHSY